MTPARQSAVSGFAHVKTVDEASEWTLPNGLRAIIVERHDVPVATVMVTYHVGSRNERLGNTGSTHILEHMMFKGSKNFDQVKGRGIGDVIEATGATINATTWNDRTNYYNIIETTHVEEALMLEADRMRNLLLRKEDLASEMVVVLNEYERGRNDPLRVLSADVWATAFMVHPYHFDTIGIKEDIVSVSTEELREFYDLYYYPNNATVSVIGDVDSAHILTHIEQAFGGLASKSLPASEIPVEPEQKGERRFVLKRSGTVEALAMGYRIPDGRHKDSPALLVLSALLSDGKGSLLHKALVNANIATAANVYPSRFYDPGLMEFSITLNGTSRHAEAEALVKSEIQRVAMGSCDEKDLLRAKALVGTRALSNLTSLGDYAHTLNEAIALGDWTDALSIATRIEGVSMDSVIRVAKQYLNDDSLTAGHLIAI